MREVLVEGLRLLKGWEAGLGVETLGFLGLTLKNPK